MYLGPISYSETLNVTRSNPPLFAAVKSKQIDVPLIAAIIRLYPNAIKETDEYGATPLMAYIDTVRMINVISSIINKLQKGPAE